jgi:putative tryptophan/tyrosine transport system substrate-binding protein
MNIKRKTLANLATLATALVTALSAVGALAQQPAKVIRVGTLDNSALTSSGGQRLEVLKKELARLGYAEGTQIIFEPRFAEGKLDRLPGFAAELVAMNVDVLVTYGGPPTNAARKATTTIPIVAALVADPVAIGVAATLARPGGNITGVTDHDPERAARQLSLLKEIFPKLARVAFMSDADIPGADASGMAPIDRDNLGAATRLGFAPQVLKLRGPSPDFAAALDSLVAEKTDAMVLMNVPVTFNVSARIGELATARRIPTLFWGGASIANGLMSYGTNFTETYARMPVFVDRILKGAKPAEMPFEVITRQELVINQKVARELGVTIPAEVLKRADRVIE